MTYHCVLYRTFIYILILARPISFGPIHHQLKSADDSHLKTNCPPKKYLWYKADIQRPENLTRHVDDPIAIIPSLHYTTFFGNLSQGYITIIACHLEPTSVQRDHLKMNIRMTQKLIFAKDPWVYNNRWLAFYKDKRNAQGLKKRPQAFKIR